LPISGRVAHALVVLAISAVSLALVAGAGSDESARSARILLRDARHSLALPPAERFALAWQLSDSLTMRALLADDNFAEHLRQWARARLALRGGHAREALEAFALASAAWPRDGRREAHLVRVVFDRQRIRTAIEAEDFEAVASFAADLRGDPEDPVIQAWLVRIRRGDVSSVEVVDSMERAWSRASRSDRHSPVFLRRALAHLANGDRELAARSWLQSIERASRPDERRHALSYWEDHPELRELIAEPGFAVAMARWLARVLRRDEALVLLQEGFEESSGRDRAERFAMVAEQHYRLRDTELLEQWLDCEWPPELDDEERAELQALPLEAERRAGSSVTLARAFEQVARDFDQTRRAVEALWEAGWMYELDKKTDDAIRLYDEYVRRGPRARFAKDAALRGLLLRYRRGDDLAALTLRFEEVRTALGEDAARGSALWLLLRVSRRDGDAAAQLRWEEELSRMDSPVPLHTRPTLGMGTRSQAKLVAAAMFRVQREAFAAVRASLGAEWEADRHVVEAAELLRLGLVESAERELLALVRDRAEDTQLLFDVTEAAWRFGSPEIQARVGFLLRRRLRDDGEALQDPLWVISRPTPFFDAVWAVAEEFAVVPELLWAIMRRESFYDPDVVSIAGAHGLVQIMPKTAETISRQEGWSEVAAEELFRPAQNLRFGAQHLRDHLDEFAGNPYLALAAYNAGPQMARTWRDRLPEGEPEAFGALLISYTETRGYVYDVLRNAELYARSYGLR
jgi:tetratricopeptide (TPR) repeat protein